MPLNMAGYEMDPLFCKALKLLHSNVKDSADQIMHLLEEVIEQKYGGTKTLNLKSGSFLFEESSKNIESQKSARPSRGSSPVSGGNPVQSNEKSSRDSTPLSEPISSRASPDVDDGDLALEIFEDDLNCAVCKGMSVGARNRLVECSDCHLLYHQECHKPPISENDVNDPRLVWYCSDCTKKNQEKVQPPKAKAIHSESSHKKQKTEGVQEKSLFKRSEKSLPSNNSSDNNSKALHLAAALQAPKSSPSSNSALPASSKHHSSTSSSNNNSGSKSSTSLHYSKNPGSPNPKSQSSGSAPAPANIIAADKRLQNMKKKAAAKMQEKRSKHK